MPSPPSPRRRLFPRSPFRRRAPAREAPAPLQRSDSTGSLVTFEVPKAVNPFSAKKKYAGTLDASNAQSARFRNQRNEARNERDEARRGEAEARAYARRQEQASRRSSYAS
jgi:hypothetical protein